MRVSRFVIACLCLEPVSCSKGDDVDTIGICEAQSATLRLVTQDAGSTIAAATVEGCPATIVTRPTCERPVAMIQVSSTFGGGPICVFKVYATDGRVFVGSSAVEKVKLTPGYRCKNDPGGIFAVDSYLQFSPPEIAVDFESADVGSVDAHGCPAPDSGTMIDAR